MDPNIETDGLAKRENFQNQPVPSYPDNAKIVAPSAAAFYDGPVTLYAMIAASVIVIPEGNRKEAETLIEAHTIANDGTPPADITEVSGYEGLTIGWDIEAGAIIPFRVCMVLEATADGVLAVY